MVRTRSKNPLPTINAEYDIKYTGGGRRKGADPAEVVVKWRHVRCTAVTTPAAGENPRISWVVLGPPEDAGKTGTWQFYSLWERASACRPHEANLPEPNEVLEVPQGHTIDEHPTKEALLDQMLAALREAPANGAPANDKIASTLHELALAMHAHTHVLNKIEAKLDDGPRLASAVASLERTLVATKSLLVAMEQKFSGFVRPE